MRRFEQFCKFAFKLGLCLVLILISMTLWDYKTPSLSLRNVSADSERFQVVDRHGEPLGISYQNRFNTNNIIQLHAIPQLLREAFITSEDRQFFNHGGVDWHARIGALWQDFNAGRKVRGASTITEQVIRIVNPRPRTLWSRWMEGVEASVLEFKASKGEILEFYLNQVPYAANRRGVGQAARYYFNRDLDTLTHKEMLALAVLPRAPSALDLYKNPDTIEAPIERLAKAMQDRGEVTIEENKILASAPLVLEPPPAPLNAVHFINYIRESVPYNLSHNGVLQTTLDSDLQSKAQKLLNERIISLKRKKVNNGAVIVIDHTTGEILAWVVGGGGGDEQLKSDTPAHDIDTVRTPRQPGSSMKPFLYAMALDKGWSPATMMDDAPMAEAIGTGLHDFHNYSHTFYGKISLREALGNSLNIPALETIGFVGPDSYLDKLHTLGFDSLTKPAEFYKDGLALGNGEVTLFEMAQAYCALANKGVFRPLTTLTQSSATRESKQVYSEEAASLIGNILSDPFARRKEFGAGSILNLPVQTAVKTGTSTDYRDAWAIGYNSRYTVGVWLGNLNQAPMDGITGSVGPALVLRGIFAALNEKTVPKGLYISPKLTQMEICTGGDSKAGKNKCFPRTEYFIAGTEPKDEVAAAPKKMKLVRPTENLQLAYDPRVPESEQAFEFVVDGIREGWKLEWELNGKIVAKTDEAKLLWPVARGKYFLKVNAIDEANRIVSSDSAHFNVK